MHLFRGILPKSVLTPQNETICHFFKMTIFSKFFGDFMRHIIRYNAVKKIKYFFELFINEKLIKLLSDLFRIGLYIKLAVIGTFFLLLLVKGKKFPNTIIYLEYIGPILRT